MALLYRARAGIAGVVASLLQLGMDLVEVPDNVLVGAKYTVGPDWSGAEYPTIPEAVAAVLADGHSGSTPGQIVEIAVYPGRYPEDVVIPSTMPRFVFTGAGADSGTEITGNFTVNLPTSDGEFAFSEVGFLGSFSISQVGGVGPSIIGRFFDCSFQATTFSTQTLSWRAFNCTFNGVANWLFGNSGFVQGGRITGGLTAQCNTAGATEIDGAYISGLCTFRGRAVGMGNCLIYHAGSYAIVDECTTFSEYTQNTASRNAGPAGAVVLKSGTSDLTDGGNVFVDGSTYPFFEITGGARPNRGQTDDELRNVLHVSGSPTLTPAEVGGQRKTTVAKDDSGGSVTLPAIASVEPGCTIVLKDVSGNATAAPWTVVPNGAETIDGAASYSISTNFASVQVQADPVAVVWMVIGSYL